MYLAISLLICCLLMCQQSMAMIDDIYSNSNTTTTHKNTTTTTKMPVTTTTMHNGTTTPAPAHEKIDVTKLPVLAWIIVAGVLAVTPPFFLFLIFFSFFLFLLICFIKSLFWKSDFNFNLCWWFEKIFSFFICELVFLFLFVSFDFFCFINNIFIFFQKFANVFLFRLLFLVMLHWFDIILIVMKLNCFRLLWRYCNCRWQCLLCCSCHSTFIWPTLHLPMATSLKSFTTVRFFQLHTHIFVFLCCGICLCSFVFLFSVFLFLFDLFTHDWTVCLHVCNDIVLYGCIMFCTFVLVPFAYFYYEEDDEDVTVRQRMLGGCKYTSFLVVILIVLIVIGALLKGDKPHNLPFQPQDKANASKWLGAIFTDQPLTFVVTFGIASLTLLGFLCVITYTVALSLLLFCVVSCNVCYVWCCDVVDRRMVWLPCQLTWCVVRRAPRKKRPTSIRIWTSHEKRYLFSACSYLCWCHVLDCVCVYACVRVCVTETCHQRQIFERQESEQTWRENLVVVVATRTVRFDFRWFVWWFVWWFWCCFCCWFVYNYYFGMMLLLQH